MPPGADVMTKDPIASVQKCAQDFQYSKSGCVEGGSCGLEKTRIPQDTFYSGGKYGNIKPLVPHWHTQILAMCPGQDIVSSLFGPLSLTEGEESPWLWHQLSKRDTIYHWPLQMETFITSWQENLVENNHLVSDNNYATSSGHNSETVLNSLLLWGSHIVMKC